MGAKEINGEHQGYGIHADPYGYMVTERVSKVASGLTIEEIGAPSPSPVIHDTITLAMLNGRGAMSPETNFQRATAWIDDHIKRIESEQADV